MGIEKYQPSEQEIADAGKKMTLQEGIQTKLRETAFARTKEEGLKDGIEIDTEKLSLNRNEEGAVESKHFEGRVKEHQLGATIDSRGITVSVDGVKLLDEGLARKIFNRYFVVVQEALEKIEYDENLYNPADTPEAKKLEWKAASIAEKLLREAGPR